MTRIDLFNQNWGIHPVFLRSKICRSLFVTRQVLDGSFDVKSEPSQDIQDRNKSSQNTAKQNTAKKISNFGLNMIIASAILISTTLFAPSLYHQFFPVQVKQVMAQTDGTVLGGDFDLGAVIPPSSENGPKVTIDENGKEVIAVDSYLPPRNEELPEGDWLVIPRIGVRSELQTTQDYRDALDTGLWMAPNFGRPGDSEKPTIIAGHRYGWDWWWKDEYWKYNSFYYLADLEPGDTFDIITDKRRWTYEIYSGEEGAQISDYDADVILYTCKYLTGPVRHFRYARLVNPNL